MCGHGTMGAVMTLIEAGFLPVTGKVMPLVIDTPSGPVETRAYMKNGHTYIYRIDPGKIIDTHVLYTIFDGKIVFSAEP